MLCIQESALLYGCLQRWHVHSAPPPSLAITQETSEVAVNAHSEQRLLSLPSFSVLRLAAEAAQQ